MSAIKKNILANLFGNAFSAIISIVFIPVYVHYLGVEAYGLIGLFVSLQVIFSVLDLGLSATLNREFARLSVIKDGTIEQRNLLRTFEYIYFSTAAIIAIIIILFAPIISKYWLNNTTIPQKTVQYVLVQMGFLLALRWPIALYAGGLKGLQNQVLYNIVNTSTEFIKAVGAIATLVFVSSSITAFFYWQIIVSGITVLILKIILWKKIKGIHTKAVFLKSLIVKNKAFAVGMGGTSLAVIILTQTDKIILSKILDLKDFGYYSLATAISFSLYRIIAPISQAVYPRMVQLVHNNKSGELIKIYHTSSQFIAAIVLPFALTISFFSKEIIMVWTHDASITNAVYPLVRILIIGTACNSLVTIPYMIQLAYGWTKLGFYQNVIAIIILIPTLIYLANLYGAYGAVWCWTILNACYLIFSMPVMFSKFLKTEQWEWYWSDITKPSLYTIIILAVGKLLLNYLFIEKNFILALYISFFSFLCFFAIICFTANIRKILISFLSRLKLKSYK